jgi:hypothetical protein
MHLNKARPLNILGEAIALTGDLDLFYDEFCVSDGTKSFYRSDYL